MKTLRAFAILAATLGAIAAVGCAAKDRERPLPTSRIDKGPGTTTSARKFLEGRWSLASFEVFPPGREALDVKGSGTLLYDDFGNLDMQIRMDPDTAAKLASVGIVSDQGVIASKGRVVIDMQQQKLTYIMEGQPAIGAPSGPLATNRPRYWQVDGNILTLTTKDDAGKPLSIGKWRKEQ